MDTIINDKEGYFFNNFGVHASMSNILSVDKILKTPSFEYIITKDLSYCVGFKISLENHSPKTLDEVAEIQEGFKKYFGLPEDTVFQSKNKYH